MSRICQVVSPLPTRCDETDKLVREAIQFHLEEMRADNEEIPEPSASAVLVEA